MQHITNPVILNSGEGKEIVVGNSKLNLKLFSEATSNKFSITEYELSPNFLGPPLHKHKVFEHAWYILEGDLTIQVENEIFVLGRGSFIFVPKLTAHAFTNKSDTIVRILVIDTPGGFEHYYDDLHTAFGDGQVIDQAKMRSIQLKYDTYPPDHVFLLDP